jgi:hypothetical protein
LLRYLEASDGPEPSPLRCQRELVCRCWNTEEVCVCLCVRVCAFRQESLSMAGRQK